MSNIGNNAHYYVAGAGIWSIGGFVIKTYPAVILALWIMGCLFDREPVEQRVFNEVRCVWENTSIIEYGALATFSGVIIFLVLACILVFLNSNIKETWGIVVFLYIITFYPYLKCFEWVLTSNSGPWPGVNWLPFI